MFLYYTYLINLPSRQDRLASALAQCEAQRIKPKLFPAIDGTTFDGFVLHHPRKNEALRWNAAAAALVKTTILILEEAMEKQYDSILILEDDVVFHPQFAELVETNFHKIPEDWESINFGCLHMLPYEMLNDTIARVGGAYNCHCYALRASVFSYFHSVLQSLDRPLDHYTLQFLHPRGKSYCFVPDIAFQSGSPSSIWIQQ
jgi:hypothetical protein